MRASATTTFLASLTMLSALTAPCLAQSHSVSPPRDSSDSSSSKSNSTKSSSSKSKSTKSSSSKSNSTKSSSSKGKSTSSSKKRLDPGPRADSDDDDATSTVSTTGSGCSSCSVATEGTFGGRVIASIGGHVTIVDDNLALLGQKVGGGADAMFAMGPKGWPVLFGAQGGIDGFGSIEQDFTYDDSYNTYRLSRMGGWLHGLVRLSPANWPVRPHLDLLGGVWGYGVSVKNTEGEHLGDVGNATTGYYGFGFGAHYVAPNGLMVGLSALHMRGGKMTVPDTTTTEVRDGVLYYSETTLSSVHQWVLMLEIGFDSN